VPYTVYFDDDKGVTSILFSVPGEDMAYVQVTAWSRLDPGLVAETLKRVVQQLDSGGILLTKGGEENKK
jgi:hypothetical protein